MCLFCCFNFKRNYGVLKSKSPCILLNKITNFNKKETWSKMENPTHSFRELNLVIQLKTVMSWSSQKKKEGIFCTVYFVRRNFFNTSVSEYTYFYKSKNITSYTFLFAFEMVKRLQCILKGSGLDSVSPLIKNCKENFANASNRLLEYRNWTFPVVR